MNLKRVLASVFALGLASPSAAEVEYYREAPGGWAIAAANSESCGLLNRYEIQGNTTTLFVNKDINGRLVVAVDNPSWTIQEGQLYNVEYTLNGSTYDGPSTALKDGFGIMFNEEFERDFALGDGLYMTIDGKVIDNLSLRGSSLALKYLNECVSILKREHNAAQREKARFAYIDADPFATAKPLPPQGGVEPKPLFTLGATWSDYPSKSLAEGQEGTAKFLVKVSSTGRVATCTITSSSGHSELDAATCKIVMRRAKFDPATDAQGKPIVGYFEGTLDWELPR